MLFDFSIPITWTDIINVIAAMSTMAAVIVAIIANIKTQKQLNVSLAMQEQTKNIDLLDKRIAIANELEKENPDTVNRFNIVIFFNDEIVKMFFEYFCKFEESKNAIDQRTRFWELLYEKTDDADNIRERIERYQLRLEDEEWGDLELIEKFKLYCKKHEITETVDHEKEVYNYFEILTNERRIGEEVLDLREKLLVKMGAFISQSIDSVNI